MSWRIPSSSGQLQVTTILIDAAQQCLHSLVLTNAAVQLLEQEKVHRNSLQAPLLDISRFPRQSNSCSLTTLAKGCQPYTKCAASSSINQLGEAVTSHSQSRKDVAAPKTDRPPTQVYAQSNRSPIARAHAFSQSPYSTTEETVTLLTPNEHLPSKAPSRNYDNQQWKECTSQSPSRKDDVTPENEVPPIQVYAQSNGLLTARADAFSQRPYSTTEAPVSSLTPNDDIASKAPNQGYDSQQRKASASQKPPQKEVDASMTERPPTQVCAQSNGSPIARAHAFSHRPYSTTKTPVFPKTVPSPLKKTKALATSQSSTAAANHDAKFQSWATETIWSTLEDCLLGRDQFEEDNDQFSDFDTEERNDPHGVNQSWTKVITQKARHCHESAALGRGWCRRAQGRQDQGGSHARSRPERCCWGQNRIHGHQRRQERRQRRQDPC